MFIENMYLSLCQYLLPTEFTWASWQNADYDLVDLEQSGRFCSSNQVPGDAKSAQVHGALSSQDLVWF